jgi:hypothetical protein
MSDMRRLYFLALGIALVVFIVLWCLAGVSIYLGYALSRGGLDISVVVWPAVLFFSAWGAFAALRRAFRSQRKELGKPDNAVSQSERAKAEKSADARMQTADEKLTALLKPPKDSEGR